MSTPNQPNPNAVPNMSLDDGETPPAASRPAAPPQSSYQAAAPVVPASPLPPIEFGPEPASPSPRNWRVDGRVLAPWEPDFRYSGTILKIEKDEARGDQALIAFDDGDEGWVFLESLEPIVLKRQARVFSRRNMGPQHLPARIIDIEGESVYVEFEDGSSEWTRVGALRIPCVPNGPGAEPTHIGASRMPIQQFHSEAGSGGGSAVPGWVIWIGVVILINILRFACRSANH